MISVYLIEFILQVVHAAHLIHMPQSFEAK